MHPVGTIGACRLPRFMTGEATYAWRARPIGVAVWAFLWLCSARMAAQFSPYADTIWSHEPFRWVSQACGDGCNDVWFCHNYYFGELPDEAYITVATAGWAEIFVNGRNIDTAVLAPAARDGAESVCMASYDITRFMRRGINTFSVDYAPRRSRCGGCTACSTAGFDRMIDGCGYIEEPYGATAARTAPDESAGQIALCFYGTRSDGTEFSACMDSGWLCRTGRRVLTPDGGEMIDGRKSEYRTGIPTDELALWSPAEEKTLMPPFLPTTELQCGMGMAVTGLYAPTFVGSSASGYAYRFGQAFVGTVRLTLRDCKKGEHVRAGKLRYICNGSMDEQAFCKFAPQTVRQIDVAGGRGFSSVNIYSVEGVSIGIRCWQ